MTEQKPRETLAERLWRNRNSIALWGGSLLVLETVWGAAIAWGRPLPSPQREIIMTGAMLPLVLWSYVFFSRANDKEYRRLLLAGKIATPEESAAVMAVPLKKKGVRLLNDDIWKALDPREAGKPDPGYGGTIDLLPRWLRGPAFFGFLLLLLYIAMTGEAWLDWAISWLPDGLVQFAASSLLAILLGVTVAALTRRARLRKIRASLR